MNPTQRARALGSLNQIAPQYRGTVREQTEDDHAEVRFPDLTAAAQFVEQRALHSLAALREPATAFDSPVVLRIPLAAYARQIGLGD